jgi:hypothetical protein
MVIKSGKEGLRKLLSIIRGSKGKRDTACQERLRQWRLNALKVEGCLNGCWAGDESAFLGWKCPGDKKLSYSK